jgi:hypothetical protein
MKILVLRRRQQRRKQRRRRQRRQRYALHVVCARVKRACRTIMIRTGRDIVA